MPSRPAPETPQVPQSPVELRPSASRTLASRPSASRPSASRTPRARFSDHGAILRHHVDARAICTWIDAAAIDEWLMPVRSGSVAGSTGQRN
jgi:hypothetical protein